MNWQISWIKNRNLFFKYAEVAELVDKLDSKQNSLTRVPVYQPVLVGSSPAFGTKSFLSKGFYS